MQRRTGRVSSHVQQNGHAREIPCTSLCLGTAWGQQPGSAESAELSRDYETSNSPDPQEGRAEVSCPDFKRAESAESAAEASTVHITRVIPLRRSEVASRVRQGGEQSASRSSDGTCARSGCAGASRDVAPAFTTFSHVGPALDTFAASSHRYPRDTTQDTFRRPCTHTAWLLVRA